MTTPFGTVTAHGDLFDLAYERIYPTTVADLWQAVTQADRLARWMEVYTGELTLGGRWSALNGDGSVYCTGTVTACSPPHAYTTTWEYTGEPPSVVSIEVAEHPDGARLLLRHEGVADTDYGPGWQTYLEQLDDDLGVAPSAAVDPDRAPGVTWEQRFGELRVAWQPILAAAGVDPEGRG